MKSFKYIAVLILYSFLLILDFLFVLTTIGMAFDDKDASVSDSTQVDAVVVCAVISAFLIFLTVKCRSYSKKLDKIKDDAPEIKKVDTLKTLGGAVSGPAAKSSSKNGKYAGIGCLVILIPIVFAGADGFGRWFWLAAIIFAIWGLATGRFPTKSDRTQDKNNERKAIDNLAGDDGCDEPLWTSGIDSIVNENAEKQKNKNLKPNYEIKYKDAEGNISVRKIFVRRFDGRVLEAHCFLRGEERTFYVPRIVECVDLETGEVINADEFYGDLRWYFCKRFNKRYKPSDMFNFDEWSGFSFSSFTPLLGEMDRFEINEVFVMKIADYDDGFITRKFSCGSVWTTRSEGFYISLEDTNGTLYDIAFNKIISVEGIEDFGKYLNDKFLNSDEGKAVRLQKNCEEELSILIYLARADSAFTAKKRNVICEYLKNSGHDCSDEILVLIGKKIKVELNAFKKYVRDYSVKIDPSKKPLFLAAANEIVGGKEKAKPFGLAGLQYVESKIK